MHGAGRGMLRAMCAAAFFALCLPAYSQTASADGFPAQNAAVARTQNAHTPHAAAQPSAPERADYDIFSAPSESEFRRKAKIAVDSAEESMSEGLASIAQSICSALLKDADKLDKETVAKINDIIADSLIAQGAYSQALAKLDASGNPENADFLTRKAAALVGENRPDEALAILDGIEPSSLGKKYVAWFRMARGFALFEKMLISEAEPEFKKAVDAAQNEYVKADAEAALSLCEISAVQNGAGAALSEAELERKVSLYMGTPAGFQFAKQYAFLLFREGKSAKAMEVIDQQLGIYLSQEVNKDELKLIGAAMATNPERKNAMLRDLIERTQSPEIADYALSLLVRTAAGANANAVEEILKQALLSGGVRMKDRILLELSKMRVHAADKKGAAEYALRVKNEYPKSKYAQEALKILAWTSFSTDGAKLPEYRLAAAYMDELAAIEPNPKKKAKLMSLAADCYFLNRDYANAAKIYSDVFRRAPELRADILTRAVEALLETNGETSAEEMLNEAETSAKNTDDSALWKAEMGLISGYRKKGENLKANARIDRALSPNSGLSDSMKLRMMWLKAREASRKRDASAAVTICNEILGKIEAADESIREVLETNTLLMKARCLDASASEDPAHAAAHQNARDVYRLLREKYPQSDAAQISYLAQARSEAAAARFVNAIALCKTFADLYPESPHLYGALFDSAQYARRTGTEENYKLALKSLDELCTRFPDNPRNFYARLEQADILRLVNDFGDAYKLYTDIINKYPAHPEIHLAWLGLGDTTLAQPNRNIDAAAIFEKLYYVPDMPVAAKAEAAFKWAFALARAGRTPEADEVRWLTSTELLKNKEGLAKYWIGRSLYELGKSLESRGLMNEARNVYTLIVEKSLPASKRAQNKLKRTPEE